MGDLRTAEIKSMCFKGGDLTKTPVLAHNSQYLVAFCEPVRNHLVTIDFTEHQHLKPLIIYKVGHVRICITENVYEKNPLFIKIVRDMEYSIGSVMKIWGNLNEYIETNKNN